MPVDLRIRGADDFKRAQARLNSVGTKELRRDMRIGINRAIKPMTLDVRTSTPRFMPDTYAAELSETLKVKTRRRAGKDPHIYLVATAKTKKGKPRNLGSLNRGRLRHPLYGNRRHWFDQPVDPGWWTRPLDSNAPRVRRELIRVFDHIIAELSRG